MAWIKTMYGNIVIAPISQFVCDAEADVADLPTDVAMGSQALVIATGAVYVIDSSGIWTLIS